MKTKLFIPFILTFLLAGCSKPQEKAVVPAPEIPYVLYGESDNWQASYTVSNASKEELAQYDTMMKKAEETAGKDSKTYQKLAENIPCYSAKFYLKSNYPEKLKTVQQYSVVFAAGTEYEARAEMKRDSLLEGFEESLDGTLPLWSNSYSSQTDSYRFLPPVDGSCTLSVTLDGNKETITMTSDGTK